LIIFYHLFFSDLLKHQINQKILLDPMKILMVVRVRRNQGLLLENLKLLLDWSHMNKSTR
jgi:hypothetical protein